ncbi:MAG: thioredoxin-disulfide reductase [Anaerolineae bacterium]|nr:MAG: thioredoxin-disulfide reductase [Anaerolineae bacterium]
MFNLSLGSEGQVDAQQLFDVVIVGAGAAGFTAGIYTARDGWKTLILEKEASGGLAASTHKIENYPGFPQGIDGSELMERFQQQAERFGAQLAEFDAVTRIEKNAAGLFEIHTESGKMYRGRAVLLATGSQPKKLGIPGEAELYPRGVSYCATCDGPLYADQEVAVVGCGNSGLQEAEILLQYARKVTFVEYLDHSIAEKVLQERVQSNPKAVCKLSHQVVEIKGEQSVSALVIKDRQSGQVEEIPVAAVFIYVGYQPDTDFVRGLVDLDEHGYILTDEHMRTSVEGIFAAGDVRANNLAQVAVAVGDGAKAAVAMREYLQRRAPQG